MKYLCLIYQDEADLQKMPKEMSKLSAEYQAFTEALQKSGQLIIGLGLQPTHTATTVRALEVLKCDLSGQVETLSALLKKPGTGPFFAPALFVAVKSSISEMYSLKGITT